MELFQELVFTISFSLIVSLLITKLVSVASTFDDGNSTVVLKKVEEKIEKEWVVCDSKKDVLFQDLVEVSEDVGFECVDDELVSEVVINDVESVGVVDEMYERSEVIDNCVGLVESDEGNMVECSGLLLQEGCVKFVEVEHGSRSSSVVVGEEKFNDEDEIFDDDWQGIETTELEKSFGAAVAFMDSSDRANLIDNEVKIELYGLHKVAIEGFCFEPQPMALKVSARANWNSWKRLENLGREDAMEQYIALLSQHVPDWIGRHASDKQ